MTAFNNYTTIHRLIILRKELDELNRQRYINQDAFNKLCDRLEDNMSERDYEEGTIQLQILLAKADEIFEKLQKFNAIFRELKSELTN